MGEFVPVPELTPPPTDIWDDTFLALICLDNTLGTAVADFNRSVRSTILDEVGLVSPHIIDATSPELWSQPSKSFWKNIIHDYSDGGFDRREFIQREIEQQWDENNERPTELEEWLPLFRSLYSARISAQVAGSLDPSATHSIVRKLEGTDKSGEYTPIFALPETILPDTPLDSNRSVYSGISVGLDSIENYLLPIHERSVVVTDNLELGEEAKKRGYTVIGVLDASFSPQTADYYVASPSQIHVNEVEEMHDDYVPPEIPPVSDSDGSSDFWADRFWKQIDQDPAENRGSIDTGLQRMGFKHPVVRKTVVSAIHTEALQGKTSVILPEQPIILTAYDRTPYRGRQCYFEHDTLIGRFANELGVDSEYLRLDGNSTGATHLLEDSQGTRYLEINRPQILMNMLSSDGISWRRKDEAGIGLIREFMRSYGIDYIIQTGHAEGHYAAGQGLLFSYKDGWQEVEVVTEVERQKQAIDKMVDRAAQNNGFTERRNPELWRMFVTELWDHWDNDLPINVFELAESLGSLATEEYYPDN